MKKILALVLAVAMLCTAAFAWVDLNEVGATGAYDTDNVWGTGSSTGWTLDMGYVYPCDAWTLEINPNLFKALWDGVHGNGDFEYSDVTAANFAVTTNFTSGGSLVTGTWKTGGGYVYVTNETYDTILDGKADIEFKRIYIKLRGSLNDHIELLVKNRTIDDVNNVYTKVLYVDSFYTGGTKQDKTEWPEFLQTYLGLAVLDFGWPVVWTNGYKIETSALSLTKTVSSYAVNESLKNFIGTSVTNNMWGTAYGDPRAYTAKGVHYMWAQLGDIGDSGYADLSATYMIGYSKATALASRTMSYVYYGYTTTTTVSGTGEYRIAAEFSLKNGQYLWLEVVDGAAIEALEDEYDTYFEYISFVGNPSIKAKLSMFADDDQFIYAYDAKGNISESGFTFDKELGYWTADVSALGNYLISDIELKVSGAADEDGNPDTGANDVVGIASALAVVAVISAAAISLKK